MNTITMHDMHRVDLPAGFTFRKASHRVAGDFDAILYSIAEIATFEDGGRKRGGKYVGPFAICYDGGETFEVQSLAAAKREIDKMDREVAAMLKEIETRHPFERSTKSAALALANDLLATHDRVEIVKRTSIKGKSRRHYYAVTAS